MRHLPPARRRRLAHVPQAPPLGTLGAVEAFRESASAAESRVLVRGWAWPFADERLARVELVVGDRPVGLARLTLRPDIAEALDLPDAMLSGFEAELDPPPAADAGQVLHAVAHGLAGTSWTAPERPVLTDLEPLAESSERGERTATATASPCAGTAVDAALDRELLRRRLGYDPWHRVALVDAPAAGVAIAALDVLAEREPDLELLAVGIEPESVAEDLVRRAIAATGLTDRVTVPRDAGHADRWRAIADAPLGGDTVTDLRATVERLVALASA